MIWAETLGELCWDVVGLVLGWLVCVEFCWMGLVCGDVTEVTVLVWVE